MSNSRIFVRKGLERYEETKNKSMINRIVPPKQYKAYIYLRILRILKKNVEK